MRIKLLPIEWKNIDGVLNGYIGEHKVGVIKTGDGKHSIVVYKNDLVVAECELTYTEQSLSATTQQAKDYVYNKITETIIQEYTQN